MMFKKIFHKSLFIFSLIVIMTGCSLAVESPEYLVKRTIDGDTIELENGRIVRYIGIDTPELGKYQGKKKIYDPDFFAIEAMEFNRKLVEGKKVRLEFDIEKEDRYGRLLVYCFINNIFVNAAMLENGYGILFTSPPNVKYVDRFVRLQRKARQNKLGLWGKRLIIQLKNVEKYLNKIITIEGKIASIHQSSRRALLNLENHNFKIVIFKKSFPYFEIQGKSILSVYQGKTIRVTGKVKKYDKYLEIVVQHPSEIEILY